jgi:hypothetical protein
LFYEGKKTPLVGIEGTLCGAAGINTDLAIFTDGIVPAFYSINTEIHRVPVQAPVSALAYNRGVGLAIFLTNGDMLIYENDSPVYVINTGKPARAAVGLADGFIIRDSAQRLAYVVPGEEMSQLGTVPPAYENSPHMDSYEDTICFATNYGWCFASLKKGSAIMLSVISGGKPRLMIKTNKKGFIINPYEPGGVTVYIDDCKGFVQNDTGELCRANQRFAQFRDASLPEKLELNPETGIHSIHSGNAILSLCSPRSFSGFYLMGEKGEVLLFELDKYNLVQVGKVPDGCLVKSAIRSPKFPIGAPHRSFARRKRTEHYQSGQRAAYYST